MHHLVEHRMGDSAFSGNGERPGLCVLVLQRKLRALGKDKKWFNGILDHARKIWERECLCVKRQRVTSPQIMHCLLNLSRRSHIVRLSFRRNSCGKRLQTAYFCHFPFF